MARLLQVLFVLLLSVSLAHGYQDPELTRDARRYHDRLLAGPATDNPLLSLRRAVRHAEQGRWPQAAAELEALLAGGEDRTLVWLRLSEAWQQQNEPERALRAAYNGWRAAATDADRARALFRLGESYRRAGQPRQALSAWEAGLELQRDADIAHRYRQLAESLVFRVDSVDVDVDTSQPRICLRFTATLADDPDLHHADYLLIEPAIEAAVSVREERLCIDGARHGNDYRITVRAGLPAADGSRTADTETFAAAVGNRPARVGFRGNAYVLPRHGDRNLPLTSVNVERVRLQLLRINDRNLTEQLNNDSLFRVLDGYASDRIGERSGEALWSGELAIASELNREVTTAVSMADLLPATEPGIYVITAEDAAVEATPWRDRATQWLVISDLGISTLRGGDGLHVFLRSLEHAGPLDGVGLRLYARNNSELGRAMTDAQGQARFAPGLLRGSGGREPALLMADHGGDYNFLDLTRPAFDLGDRGVAGRPAPDGFDAYLYSDRGVYRPGETVELVTLLRDTRGRTMDRNPPLTLRLLRPDQVEAERLIPGEDRLGGYHTRLDLPANARTGTWQVLAHVDPQGPPVGDYRFQVEDFVPQQLRLTLDSDRSWLDPETAADIGLEGEYLYGAPAAHLNAEAELVLQADPDPYPAYPGYRFGRVQERFDARRQSLELTATDAEGRGRFQVLPEPVDRTSLPLRATVRVSLFEPGGRPVNQTLTLGYRHQPYALGIKPLFGDSVEHQQAFAFEVLALNPDGTPRAAPGLRYELIREDHEYYWYYQNNRWDYRLIVRDSPPLAERELDPGAAPLRVEQAGLDWGHYRIEVYDPDSDVASSLRFRVGWMSTPEAGDSPDRLRLSLDRDSYSPGETARVHIQAPFAGELLLAVAGDRLWQTHTLSLPAEGTVFDLPVSGDWSPGAYLMATAFRPAAQGRGPGRAVGVAWLGLEQDSRTLRLAFEAPEVLRPRQSVELPVRVEGVDPGQSAWLTLAAVDEGILQLTDYPSPDPLAWFLGKRRLGLDLLDLYGRLIESGGRPGALRSGAGADERNLDASGLDSVQTVALFSGPVQVDGDGSALIRLDLPDFNGELRLMAVAWDAHRYGRAERPLTVRDPLVAEVYRPRFLAPDDRAQLLLALRDLDAPPGDYQASLEAGGALELVDAAPLRVRFGAEQQPATLRQSYTLRGLHPGSGELRLELSGPEGYRLQRQWTLEVRPAQTHIGEHRSLRLDTGDTLRLDAGELHGYLPVTARLRASLSSRPGINVPELLERLDRYPYGCLEQLTSRALPLIYYAPLAERWAEDATDAALLRQRVQQAIHQVLAMQQYDGRFGLWNADSATENWLSVYAMDFLGRARAADYLVPSSPYQRGLEGLRRLLDETGFTPEELAARAYALYVLARTGQAPAGELRYLHDNHLDALTPLAAAQLAAALHHGGDSQRVETALRRALSAADAPYPRADYGSPLRDRAGLLAVTTEAGLLDGRIPELAEQLASETSAQRHTSTQEQAWLLLAAHALSADRGALELSIDGYTITGVDPYYLNPDRDELDAGIEVHNTGPAPAWVQLDISGVPSTAQPPVQAGFTIGRSYYTRSGEPVDPTEVGQHELLVALIRGRIDSPALQQALVVDLLPAGFELENARLADTAGTGELAWLPELSTTDHVEIRADRYAAALARGSTGEFTLAYLVRAVTPGDYALPAPFVEDMYQPWLFGRGEMGRLMVR